VGVAHYLYNTIEKQPRGPAWEHAYLGPAFSDEEIASYLEGRSAPFRRLQGRELTRETARILSEGNVVGWFQGRMEFGPRALGGRSILADPRDASMRDTLNMKIKFREGFRPFAPSVTADRAAEWFEIDCESPYMLLVADVAKKRQIAMNAEQDKLFGIEKLNVPRSTIPAATHVDYSARIQTVHRETNPRYYDLINEFFKLTGCPVIVNTSFNVRGEPIVCTPEDAYRCFMRTEMDYLVLDDFLLAKIEQPEAERETRQEWKDEYPLD